MFKNINCRPDEYLKVTLRDERRTITLSAGDSIFTGWFWTSLRDDRNREWIIPTWNISSIVKKKVP